MGRSGRLLTLTTLALMSACDSDPTGLGDAERLMTGAFDWLSSSGGIAGRQFTPASEGYSVRLEFAGDQVRAFRSGTLVGEARFTLREDSLRASPQPVYLVEYEPTLQVFPFDAFEQHTLRIVGKLVVELDDGCCDRYTHTFAKSDVR